jgi:hypothetical protein
MNFFSCRSDIFKPYFEMMMSEPLENNSEKSVMVLRYFPGEAALLGTAWFPSELSSHCYIETRAD